MLEDGEVIDVEAFHRDSQHKSHEDLKKRYKKLRQENQSLETKINKLHYVEDDLRRKLFDQDHRQKRLARLLGFDDVESLENTITDEDPWIPGGHAALSEARARILLLEDELAKHVTANKETQIVLAETHDQIIATSDQLHEATRDAMRLREQRDFARGVAEKQAAEAYNWRVEAQTTLPDMRTTIKELQRQILAQTLRKNRSGKENVTAGQREPTCSPLHDLANTIVPTTVDNSSTPPIPAPDVEHYKHQFERLHVQYNALLACKDRISKKYREDLAKWKRFKAWLAKDEVGDNMKPKTQRRILRRKKVLDEIGPQVDSRPLELPDDSAPTNQTLHGPTKDLDPDITRFHESDSLPQPEKEDMAAKFQPFLTPTPRSPTLSGHQVSGSPPLDVPPLEESLTQQSNLPPISQRLQPAARSPGILLANDSLPLSQESLTQPSTARSPTPSHECMASPSTDTPVKNQHQEAIVIDSSPERAPTAMRQAPLENSMAVDVGMSLSHRAHNPRIKCGKSRLDFNARAETPKTCSELTRGRKRPRTVLPISEPPAAHKSSFPPRTNLFDTHVIRRSSTVLAIDTPPRANASVVTRHHSSPPDPTHVRRVSKEKRKATEMEDDGENADHNDGNESDPFTAGPSHARSKPSLFQTREEKAAHLTALKNKPNKEYMAEYMQFKGRGRYSNVHAAADKTVNSEFEIDPSRNGGVKYQFDAVVRDKVERKKLEAGDCECCRDYYEAVGPLPPRLQAPLWRSPSSSQSLHASRPCRYQNTTNHDNSLSPPSAKAQINAIEGHKHDISRHRHNWAPPNTPPDYWHIGFPDTQAVVDINRRADKIHEEKFQRAEAEANSKNGRYRKRV